MPQQSLHLSNKAESKLGSPKPSFWEKEKPPRRTTGGIRLERKKEATLLNWNLKRPYPSETIRIPSPAFSRPCVQIGEVVQVGQKIAEPEGPNGASLHASMAGVVTEIAAFPSAMEREDRMIEIHRQGEPKPLPLWEVRKGWDEIPAEDLADIFQRSGLMTTDPLMEPVHAKIKRHAGARTMIINVCEPEPYITCEQVLTMSHPVEVLKGAELLKKALGAEKILFAVEDSNLEVIELLKSKIYFLKWKQAEVRTVPALYPQGLEYTLLQAWFPGEEEKGCVFPASTAFAAYEAIALEKPFYERVVTVGGECIVEPRSLWLPVGVSFYDAIRACKGVMREPQMILMGGPMAGTAQRTSEVSVMAGTNAILALPGEVVKKENEEPCIRCNLCVDHCPASLSPVMITLAAEQKEFSVAAEYDIQNCIGCGTCAYLCPSKRPMLELIRSALLLPKPAASIAARYHETKTRTTSAIMNRKKIKKGTSGHD